MLTAHTEDSSERDTHPRNLSCSNSTEQPADDRGIFACQSWFKRPSLTWILCMKILSSLATNVTAGARVEMYTELVCRATRTSVIPPGSCASRADVQAEVAKLVIAIIGGVLSCCTAGWWGGFLDRHGRTRTMGIIVLGPLLSDLLTFVIFHFSDVLPGKYWFLVVSPLMEGIMGAPTSVMAAETSYARDVTKSSELARSFSWLIGIFYAGGAIGPILGGFLNQRTDSVMTAFYAATIIHLLYAFLAWFVIPESVSKTMIIDARDRYTAELASVVDHEARPFRQQAIVFVRSLWNSFPLHVLAPKRMPNSRRKDWNLTYLAISAGMINAVMGSGTSVYQYALYTYKWSALELGSFISAGGLSTVIFLMVILPAIIMMRKSMLPSTQPEEETRHTTLFDLYLVRVSSMVFAVGYTMMSVAPTGLIFTLCFIIISFGQGFLPAIQSVATMLHTSISGEGDTGRLFGALGVVYVLGARIIGPAIYGPIYGITVSLMPSAILWLSVGCALTASLALAFVTLPEFAKRPSSGDPTCDQSSELEPLLGSNGV